MNAEASASPLLFNWDAPRSRKLSIVGFIGASAMLHAVCFYLFQIVYSPAVVLLPPPARVSFLTSDSEEERSMLRWVDAEDPALASATQRPSESRQRSLPRVQHIPSYVAEGPKLKSSPPFILETRAPSAYPPGPVPTPRLQSPPPPGKIATVVTFSEELAAMEPFHLPPVRFTAANHETPQTIRFRVAVSASGEIRHCFPLNSSGDTSLDEQARQYLSLVRASPKRPLLLEAASSDVWGVASIDWGNDVTGPVPPLNQVPRP
jgi:hypothetical protein